MISDVTVFYQATPNPESLKFVIDRIIATENVSFTAQDQAARSPLAHKILGFPWAAGVFIGPDFVTVTKHNWVEWEILADPLSDLIKEHVAAKHAVLLPRTAETTESDEDPADTPVVREIKKILREEIKPAVAMDGGDISFSSYKDGRVYLSMHGACAGCPSSVMTLKDGIETRLKSAIPEIVEVVAV